MMTFVGNFKRAIEAFDASGHETVVSMVKDVRRDGCRLFFIGNGGSAAIASHMAADFLKNGNMAAMSFTDGPAVTAISNDVGYDKVFWMQLNRHCRHGDFLFAISSSGRSASILNGVAAARDNGADIVTLSGFDHDNPLRFLGDVNFYVPSHLYGIVETAHLAILHSILDEVMA